MKRTRADIRLARFLSIGQTYRRRLDGRIWTVRQVHRADAQLELQEGVVRICIPFEQLRQEWDLLLPVEQAIAP